MDKICGIVAEYNPFHKGHEYQIQKTKEKVDYDVLVVVMSGNFVQRGNVQKVRYMEVQIL